MNAEFKGNVIQKVGLTTAKGVNAIKAGIDKITGKQKNFNHNYQARMMEESRHPNMLALKGWATIIATVVGATLVVNSLK